MNSRLLHFLFALACAALIGLGPLRAQNPASGSDANGSAVTAPARQPDASHSAVSPSASPDSARSDQNADARRAADAAVANDRGTVPENQTSTSRFSAGWVGLIGLLGLLGLVRRGNRESGNVKSAEAERVDFRRAA
jgi:hypothetical protein